jgi:hypothetical protein
MTDEFRAKAGTKIACLLNNWRTTEFWIKRAEQVSKKAVIPAINELRYASRQLFNAVRLLEKEEISDGDKSAIKRRIIITEQYLLNADHDVCDSLIGFYDEIIIGLDRDYGTANIAVLFPEYPLLKKHISNSLELIAESRGDYDKRGANYKTIRENHFPHILESYNRLTDAEVAARQQKTEMERQLTIARSKIKFLEWFGIISGICSIVAVPLSIYLWVWAYPDFCKAHPQTVVIRSFCPAP